MFCSRESTNCLKTHKCISKHHSSPRVSAHSHQILTLEPTKSKTILILGNSTDYPLPGLKCIPGCYCFSCNKHTLCHTNVKNITYKDLKQKSQTGSGVLPSWPLYMLAHMPEDRAMCPSLGCLNEKTCKESTYIQEYVHKCNKMCAGCILIWYM